ncbi:MAG: ferritin-like domain-containing protein [Rhodospirillales bacterium]|nr:ferritin-like domain-containing protein [Rhodospirillales bacterium]
MEKARWTVEDLGWDRLDPARAHPDTLKIIKAAALVEYNAGDYVTYLCRIFADDGAFQAVIRQWGVEEIQHGRALGAWAEKIDPSWSLDRAMERFRAGYKPAHFADGRSDSVRGSRSAELVARCMVEVGTSSYYTALGGATDEPVLQEICRHIAADEFRHYKLFYDHLNACLEREKLGKLARLKVAVGRIAESEDDELAYAYFAANESPDATYDRETYSREYMRRACGYYRRPVVDRAVGMVFKACGLSPQSLTYRAATALAWWKLRTQQRRLLKQAA